MLTISKNGKTVSIHVSLNNSQLAQVALLLFWLGAPFQINAPGSVPAPVCNLTPVPESPPDRKGDKRRPGKKHNHPRVGLSHRVIRPFQSKTDAPADSAGQNEAPVTPSKPNITGVSGAVSQSTCSRAMPQMGAGTVVVNPPTSPGVGPALSFPVSPGFHGTDCGAQVLATRKDSVRQN